MGRVGQQKEEHFRRSDHGVVGKGELMIQELKFPLHKKRPGVWISRTRQMPSGYGGFPVILA